MGSVVALVLVLAILAIVAIAISEGGTAVPSETVPGGAPLSPGE